MASDLSKLAFEASGVNTKQPLSAFTAQQMNTPDFVRTGQNTGYMNTAVGPQFHQAPGGSGNTAAEEARLTAANAGSASNKFFASANAPMKTGQVASLTSNPNNPQMKQYQDMIQQLLMAQSKSSGGITEQYKAMLARLIGKGGLTEQLSGATANYGAGQQELLAENQKKQTGGLEQNLISRGLGNSTIRNSLLSGMNRDQGIQQQNLASNIAQQKMSSIPISSNIELGAFNANPANAQQSQYLQLLQQLGSAG